MVEMSSTEKPKQTGLGSLPWRREGFSSEFVLGGLAGSPTPQAVSDRQKSRFPHSKARGFRNRYRFDGDGSAPDLSRKGGSIEITAPVVSATGPFGENVGPSPNRANTAGLTNVTWRVPEKNPVPFGTWLTNVESASIVPATPTLENESSTSTLFAPPAWKKPVTIPPNSPRE